MPHALVVAQELGNINHLRSMLQEHGYSYKVTASLEEARTAIKDCLPDVALIRPALPDGDGLALLQDSQFANSAEILLLSEEEQDDSLITGLRVGSGDREARAYREDELSAILREVAQDLTADVAMDLGETPDPSAELDQIRGRSRAMHKLFRMVRKVAPTQASVLLIGESGTGKELLSQAIHRLSSRRDAAFVPVNCGAISEDLMESELFGHEKGSFTNASKQHRGIFERADGGTLFLDEITEMPIELQVKLLRALEYGRFSRVGGESDISVDVRVVAATNRDPAEAIQQGRLREDLFFRLAQFPIAIPPLRERSEDVELLAEYFVEQANQRHGTRKYLSEAALRRLKEYSWPGNVREMKNVIERASILADGEIAADDFLFLGESLTQSTDSGEFVRVKVGQSIQEAEKSLILATLEKNDGEKQRTAEELGISLKTLYNRLNEYGV